MSVFMYSTCSESSPSPENNVKMEAILSWMAFRLDYFRFRFWDDNFNFSVRKMIKKTRFFCWPDESGDRANKVMAPLRLQSQKDASDTFFTGGKKERERNN